MKDLAGFSDSIASVASNPAPCPECGAATRIARGMCVSCLLSEGLLEDEEQSLETFETVLAEAAVTDTEWQLGQYQILGEIGRGGMGVIYRARQRHSRRIVAVKRILSYEAESHETLVRFRREAEAAASLDHPNILPIYEVSETPEGVPFFSMKLATGGSLRAVGPALRKEPRDCVRLMVKVARAVGYAHRHGILHRDLQPGNILLDGHGEPLVSDFGLAKWLDTKSELTHTLTTLGTPGFIAPEQAEGGAAALTPAADIYSLGAILFNLLANRPPFLGRNALSVVRQAAEVPAPKLRSLVPTLDRDLETILGRCLEREAKARYASADALADDLERWVDGRPIVARPVLPSTRAWRWARRNPVFASAASGCLVLGVAVIWLLSALGPSNPVTRPPDKSIAVLPFKNLNNDEKNLFFTEGMQDDLLINLGKVADLKVISRSSVREYRPGAPRDLRAIGRELGVRHVLEGSVQRADERVRISAHLIDTETGAQLWADQYDRELRDVFMIQSAIAEQIVDQLQAKLSPKEYATIQTKPAEDMEAYDLYLRAREITHRAGLSTAERSEAQVRLLEDAVTREPTFVLALCLLARVHVLSYWSNQDHTPARLEAAWRALEHGARLQPDAGEVHLTRGIILYWGARNYGPALDELALARRALPNEADVPYFMALIARRQGDWETSTRYLLQARAIDPRNAIILWDLARTNYFATKRYEEAASVSESVLAWKPDAFDFQLARAKVDLASRGDTHRWARAVEGDATKTAEPDLLAFERLDLALTQRNYEAAEAALAAHALPEFKWDGYVTPQEWFEGLIAEGRGQPEKARTAFTAARARLRAIVAQRPDDAKAHIMLAEISARLGDKEEAIREGEKALELRPVAKDAVDGAHLLGRLAAIYGRVGKLDQALALLEQAAPLPNATNYGSLKLDECWDPLRGDPRFARIMASLAPVGNQK
ncbi:MAG: protein kinase [Chthoniobacterales bacterium]